MMRTINYVRLSIILVLLVSALEGCKPKDVNVLPEENTFEVGNIVASEMKDIVAKTIGTEGGELEVKDPQSVLNGFKLTIPKGAYPGTNSFSVSAAKVVRQNFGEEYKVLSPLISIAAPSGYIDEFITIEIPIDLPANHFAIAVFVNEAGKPDLLPMISLSANKIVVATNSFSPANQAKNGRVAAVNSLTLSVLGMEEKMLMDLNYSTGFKPGEDDWAFANRGSVIAPGGYCSASSFSSLWYLKNKRNVINKPLYQLGKAPGAPVYLKADALEGRLSAVGIKYVSVLQMLDSQLDLVSNQYRILLKNRGKPIRDKTTFLFASAYIKLINEPLQLGLDHNDLESNDRIWGHLIGIIGKQNKGLAISDPNKPGQPWLLKYIDNVGLENYPFSDAGDDSIKSIDYFYALPTWLFNKDNIVEKFWPDFESGSIINSSHFPSFTYTIKNVNENVKKTVLNSDKATKIQSPFQIEISSSPSHPSTQALLVSDSGKVVQPLATGFYELRSGVHKIGILVRQGITLNKIVHEKCWADFQWFDVEVEGDDFKDCDITTAEGISETKPGEVGKQYTFSLGTSCTFPPKTRFFWNFGDGWTNLNVDPRVSYRFTVAGTFDVKLRIMLDGASNYIYRETRVSIDGAPGGEYFTYKMNGVNYSDSDPSSWYLNSPANEGLFIDNLNYYTGYKVLTGKSWSDVYFGIYLGVRVDEWKGVGSYALTKPEKGKSAPAIVVIGGPGNNIVGDAGNLTVTKMDANWIEGIFHFNSGSFNVTEGKFRIER